MFVSQAAPSEGSDRLAANDVEHMGFVMNTTRLWHWQPETVETIFGLAGQVTDGFTMRERGLLVAATASTLGDSYCSIAWGGKLAKESDAATAASVLTADDEGLTEAEEAMVAWARKVVRDPNSTAQADVDALREVGYDDSKIFAMTVFVALRLAYSTINDALGAHPDAGLRDITPPEVLAAVEAGGYGRPLDDG